MSNTLLFDLDGTIINTKLGITSCVKYALEHFGIIEEDMNQLCKFIGPPLMMQFKSLYGFSEEQALTALQKYRERYERIGMQECELYPDVEKTLIYLKKKGYKISLASSKPKHYCEKLLKIFNLAHYFDFIGGATLDGTISTKHEVLLEVMKQLNIEDAKEAVLIGDTKYDVLGANEMSMDCIGVSYGFGSAEELKRYGAVVICNSLQEVVDYIEKQ